MLYVTAHKALLSLKCIILSKTPNALLLYGIVQNGVIFIAFIAMLVQAIEIPAKL